MVSSNSQKKKINNSLYYEMNKSKIQTANLANYYLKYKDDVKLNYLLKSLAQKRYVQEFPFFKLLKPQFLQVISTL